MSQVRKEAGKLCRARLPRTFGGILPAHPGTARHRVHLEHQVEAVGPNILFPASLFALKSKGLSSAVNLIKPVRS